MAVARRSRQTRSGVEALVPSAYFFENHPGVNTKLERLIKNDADVRPNNEPVLTIANAAIAQLLRAVRNLNSRTATCTHAAGKSKAKWEWEYPRAIAKYIQLRQPLRSYVLVSSIAFRQEIGRD